MLELPTIKTDFLFKSSQDFNQTVHARPQHPIVFIHNISLYFNCISSVKYLFKWSRHAFFCSTTEAQTQKIEHTFFERWEKCLHIVWNAIFCSFYILKWRLSTRALNWIPKGHIHNYFVSYVISFCNYF